jgi:hypothetical protein
MVGELIVDCLWTERWNEDAEGGTSPSIVYMFTNPDFIGVLSGSIVYKWLN